MAPPEPSADAPSLSLNLNFNNPFRNASPLPSPPAPLSAPVRPSSTNPFLAAFESDLPAKPAQVMEPDSPQKAAIADDAKELFKRLTVVDSASTEGDPKRGPPRGQHPRHRSSRAEEPMQYRPGPNGLKIPIRPRRRHPDDQRGNRERRRPTSDATLTEPRPMTDAERAEKEKRRAEREARHRERDASYDSKSSDPSLGPRHSRRRRNVHVDVVDKLDVTGLYGVGGMWHHDGPFDAVRPHRNRQKDALAPMNAFPTNSKNNTIGGSGPVNDGINLEQFHGLGAEGFHDYARTGSDAKPFSAINAALVNPVNRVEPVHGEETMGLGTSTFLEGAPASRQAIQRIKSEQPAEGLMRKKSLAMRIRGMSQSKRFTNGASLPPPLSPDLSKGRFQDRSAGVALTDEPPQIPSPTSPRPATSHSARENNPFEAVSKHDEEYEKKGASIKAAEEELEKNGGRERALSSPRRGVLERHSTDGGNAELDKSGGFLSRVKSLKGPKRVKSERQPS